MELKAAHTTQAIIVWRSTPTFLFQSGKKLCRFKHLCLTKKALHRISPWSVFLQRLLCSRLEASLQDYYIIVIVIIVIFITINITIIIITAIVIDMVIIMMLTNVERINSPFCSNGCLFLLPSSQSQLVQLYQSEHVHHNHHDHDIGDDDDGEDNPLGEDVLVHLGGWSGQCQHLPADIRDDKKLPMTKEREWRRRRTDKTWCQRRRALRCELPSWTEGRGWQRHKARVQLSPGFFPKGHYCDIYCDIIVTLLCHLLWHYCGSIVSFIVTGVGKDTRLQRNCHLGFSFNDTLANYCWECFRWVSRRNNCNCVSQKPSKYRRSSLINSLDCSNTWNGPVVEGLEEFVAAETLVVTEGAPVSSLERPG